MAAKKDFSVDALDAFDLERPAKALRPPAASAAPEEAEKAPEPAAQAPKAEMTPEPVVQAHSEIVEIKRDTKGEALMPRTYYITRTQYKALRLRAIESDRPEDKDASSIIRTAIDLYLAQK